MRRMSKPSIKPLLELENVFIGVIWKACFNSSYSNQNLIEDYQTVFKMHKWYQYNGCFYSSWLSLYGK